MNCPYVAFFCLSPKIMICILLNQFNQLIQKLEYLFVIVIHMSSELWTQLWQTVLKFN